MDFDDDCSDDECVENADQGASSFFHVRVACFIDIPDYDLTLAILEQPVTHIEPIPVKFVTPAELPVGSRIWLAGWGLGNIDPCNPVFPTPSTHQLKVVLQVLDTHDASGGLEWPPPCDPGSPPGALGQGLAGDSGGPILIETCHGLAVAGVNMTGLIGISVKVVENHPAFVGLDRCAADLNEDSTVDGIDVGIMLASWSTPATAPGCGGSFPCSADINCDGLVNGLDLGILLNEWDDCDQPVTECCEQMMAGGEGQSMLSGLFAGTPDFSSLMEWISQASLEELIEWHLNGMPVPMVGEQ